MELSHLTGQSPEWFYAVDWASRPHTITPRAVDRSQPLPDLPPGVAARRTRKPQVTEVEAELLERMDALERKLDQLLSRLGGG